MLWTARDVRARSGTRCSKLARELNGDLLALDVKPDHDGRTWPLDSPSRAPCQRPPWRTSFGAAIPGADLAELRRAGDARRY